MRHKVKNDNFNETRDKFTMKRKAVVLDLACATAYCDCSPWILARSRPASSQARQDCRSTHDIPLLSNGRNALLGFRFGCSLC